jgi:uncharacterized NAD(P)/FAD-binding protein YdhS
VGGGASGTLIAIHLLRRAQKPLRIALIDRRGAHARGAAYGTHDPLHLLNVRAGNMSAFPDAPLDFVEWGQVESTSVAAPDFLPRQAYARYLRARLDSARDDAPGGVQLDIVDDAVTSIDLAQRRVRLGSGTEMPVDRVVLALGNFEPRPLQSLSQPSPEPAADTLIRNDPWDPSALDGLERDAPVLLVGTGLTMVDVVVTLIGQRQHEGPIYAISRRGLLPQVHLDPPSPPRALEVGDDGVPQTASGLLRTVRAAASDNTDWRGVIDGLRPLTQPAWQRLPLDERARFLRHVQPYWDTHRHRTAPRIGSLIADAQARGQLQIWAGRLEQLLRRGDRLDVHVRRRDGATSTLSVARAINCTGPATNFRRIDDPLVQSLIASGIALDALDLGFATTQDGRLIDANGTPSRLVFGLGPMRRGELWETTAVPDIRVQVAALAETLLSELESVGP